MRKRLNTYTLPKQNNRRVRIYRIRDQINRLNTIITAKIFVINHFGFRNSLTNDSNFSTSMQDDDSYSLLQ